jgi:site-specific recombinase XerD
LTQFEAVLKKRAVPVSRHADYRKWLRYYLDFRGKYTLPDSKAEHVRLFIEKLREKNQTHERQKQAAHALSLFFESQPQNKHVYTSQAEATTPIYSPLSDMQQPQRVLGTEPAIPLKSAGSRYNEWRCLEKSGSPEWDKIIDNLAAEIKTRHYSRKTLKAHADWSRKFQGFLHNKPPDELSTEDVKSYLTYLSVKCKVSASTQNQAFNSLLFLYRHILKKDFGDQRIFPIISITLVIISSLLAAMSSVMPEVFCRAATSFVSWIPA